MAMFHCYVSSPGRVAWCNAAISVPWDFPHRHLRRFFWNVPPWRAAQPGHPPQRPSVSSPRKDVALGVHRFDPSANGQQVLRSRGMKLPAVQLENFLGIEWGYNWMLYNIYIYNIHIPCMYIYIYVIFLSQSKNSRNSTGFRECCLMRRPEVGKLLYNKSYLFWGYMVCVYI